MGLSIRTLLIWWLMLAVSAQGAAAATMAFCGPNHHGSPATAAAAQSHGHDVAAATPAALEATPTATPAATPAATPDASNHSTSGASHKCSACATCCSVAAMLSALPTVPAAESAPTRFAAEAVTVDTFAVDGPDRPPRRVLA